MDKIKGIQKIAAPLTQAIMPMYHGTYLTLFRMYACTFMVHKRTNSDLSGTEDSSKLGVLCQYFTLWM